MTAHKDLDRQLNDFLREGPTELPYQSFDAVRDRTEQTGQRVVIGPWRLTEMKKIVTLGLAATAVVVAVFVGVQFLGSPSVGGGSEATPTPEPTATLEPSPSAAGGLPEGPHPLWETDGMAITITIAAPDWVGGPGIGFVEKGVNGADPPGGAGMIAFADSEYYVYGDPCAWSSTRPDTPATTVDELVAALANQASREASAPEDIVVDGYAGKKVILDMADDVVDFAACDEGEFSLLGVPAEDPARSSQGPGQIDEVWIVDVEGVLVVLLGGYYADTPQNEVEEVRAILASATFELP